MEQLLHYAWKHRMLPVPLRTTDGRDVELLDPGLHNHEAGPDFFNAKVKIGGTLWVGNVEIHHRSSDWFAHGHNRDRAYDNVVLHAVEEANSDVTDTAGRIIPQVVFHVPKKIADNYAELLAEERYPPCYRLIPSVPKVMTHSWMAALQAERLERKTEDIKGRADRHAGSWEKAFFITLARNYGFGVNSDAFEQWASIVSLDAIGHHRDDLFVIEAIFLGQAGLLNIEAMPEKHRQEVLADDYFNRLCREYDYQKHKFGLETMDHKRWRFLRLRPQNFPNIKISQLANMYYEKKVSLRSVVECPTIEGLRSLLATHVTPYWERHYTFASESAENKKCLSKASIDLLLINTVIPLIFAYGKNFMSANLCDRAIDMLDSLKAEKNHIVTMWREVGLDVITAGDSQALLQLKNEYCDRKDCLRCRFGYEYLRL